MKTLMEMVRLAKFDRGETVYHRFSLTKIPGLVTGVEFRNDDIYYRVSWGDCRDTFHFGIELSTTYVPQDIVSLSNGENA